MSTSNQQTGKLPPQTLLHERYLIIGQRGRGGMSVVYEAIDTQTPGCHVAIKEMSLSSVDELDQPLALARFQQEAMILEALSHPNLPRIHNAFTVAERSYLVMDYIDGKTLFQLLREKYRQPLPVEDVLNYALQLCDVLNYLHQQVPPIIFRDVKPTNIMVTAGGHVYLIDFGIARFFKEGQAHDTEYLGSRGYAAPEQHGLNQTTPRTDIYGLGSTLHHCLSGHDPFHSADPFLFTPVDHVNPQVPPLLARLIQQMTAFNEHERLGSISEVKQALYMLTEQAADATTALTSPQQGDRATGSGQPRVADLPAPTQATVFWSAGFLSWFLLSFLLTFGGSISALVLFQPDPAGWTLLVELGLACLFWVTTVVVYWLVSRVLVRSLLALGSIINLFTCLALFTLESLDLQDRLSAVLPPDMPYIDIAHYTVTVSLFLSGLLGLVWLWRPISRLQRRLLGVPFLVAIACALILLVIPISVLGQHMLLLVALTLLIEATLFAVRYERLVLREQEQERIRAHALSLKPTQQLI